MNIEQVRDKYSLDLWNSGGGLYVDFLELNTNQDYMLLSDSAGDTVSDDSEFYAVGVYSGKNDLFDGSEPLYFFETDDLGYLCTIIDSILTLWGNA